MKLLIVSDIHGDYEGAKRIISAFIAEKCNKILILGDILYHGPRNDLPKNYSPKEVISLLNSYKENIIAVRGNCDTEVDQMVLKFPVLADYVCLFDEGITIYATHGHRYNPENPLPLCPGDIMLGGHTHVPCIMNFNEDNLYLNPGSVSIPKESNPQTYMTYERRRFVIKDFDGNVIKEAEA